MTAVHCHIIAWLSGFRPLSSPGKFPCDSGPVSFPGPPNYCSALCHHRLAFSGLPISDTAEGQSSGPGFSHWEECFWDLSILWCSLFLSMAEHSIHICVQCRNNPKYICTVDRHMKWPYKGTLWRQMDQWWPEVGTGSDWLQIGRREPFEGVMRMFHNASS